MSTKLFINAFSCLFNQNRGGFIVRGGIHTPFFDKLLWKEPFLEQICTMVKYTNLYWKGNHLVAVV